MSDRWEMSNGFPQEKSPVQIIQTNEVATYVSKVFAWMFIALAVTAGVAFLTYQYKLLDSILEQFGKMAFFGLIIIQFVLVGFLALRFMKMSMSVLIASFLGYSVINGIVFSTLFLIYEPDSIVICFGITALTFGVMSIVGYTTKTDLTSFGKLMFMGLIGIIIASIVNFFLASETLYYVISYIGVFVFIGLIAYDVQKIKSYVMIEDAEVRKKAAVMGAFSLYLDFINLFIYILRIFGNRK